MGQSVLQVRFYIILFRGILFLRWCSIIECGATDKNRILFSPSILQIKEFIKTLLSNGIILFGICYHIGVKFRIFFVKLE